MSKRFYKDFLSPQKVMVTHTQFESEDVVTMSLKMPPSYSCSPGQFNMLYAFGVGEIPISVSAFSAKTATLEHTKKTKLTLLFGAQKLFF